MFLDASAIVAILTQEPESDVFVDVLESATSPFTSPISIFEATMGLARKRLCEVSVASAVVADFLAAADVQCHPIQVEDAWAALDAMARYGKGQGHPAQLNLGDCFSYAMAARRAAPLLFKGSDFEKTDVLRAV